MLAASELLSQSFELYKKHFKLLAGYTSWLLLPYAAMVLISLPTSDNLFLAALIFICNLTQAIVGLWLAVFIPLLVVHLIKKGEAPIQNLSQKAWRILSSVVWVAILEALIIFGGTILLVIPGIIFWVWFALAQMAAILDDKKGTTALSASRELVRGKFWPMFGRLLLGPLVIGLIAVIISGLLILIVTLITQTSLDIVFGETPPLWVDVISTITETFIMPLLAVYMTLLYLEAKKSYVAMEK